jgi:hypothetical protein
VYLVEVAHCGLTNFSAKAGFVFVHVETFCGFRMHYEEVVIQHTVRNLGGGTCSQPSCHTLH